MLVRFEALIQRPVSRVYGRGEHICGIVGVFAGREAAPLVTEALARLAYRRYDSAGAATAPRGAIERRRAPGKLSALRSTPRRRWGEARRLRAALSRLPIDLSAALACEAHIAPVAEDLAAVSNMIFLGRGAMQAIAFAAQALVSLGLTALRYGDGADADAAFQERLVALLARHDVLLVEARVAPAFGTLSVRAIGCHSVARLAFAPNDGEADAALARLLPDAAGFAAAGAATLHPEWLIVTDADAARGRLSPAALQTMVSDP
jgi:hypothetical protein